MAASSTTAAATVVFLQATTTTPAELLPMNDSAVTIQDAAADEMSLNRVKIIVDVYVVVLLCLFGISGNIITILVLGRDNSVKRTTGFLLQMLALADLLYLTTCVFFQTVQTLAERTDWCPGLTYHYPSVSPFVWPLASIAQTSAVWLVVLVTCDRYVAICRPLHAPQYSTSSRARKAVVIVWMLSILYNLPRFFEKTTVMYFDSTTNTTYPKALKTPLRNDSIYFIVYKTCLFFVIRFLIPLSGLAFFNTRLIQAIRHSQRIQRRNTDASRKERYTLTLIVVVIVFALCVTPDFLLRVWVSAMEVVPSLNTDRYILLYINTFTNLCLTINSCVNFVIYCFLGQKFRRILRQVLCKQAARCRLKCFRSGETSEILMDDMTTLVTSVEKPSQVASCSNHVSREVEPHDEKKM